MARPVNAESFLNNMRLPLAVCPVVRELYGYAHTVLDVAKATQQLRAAGFHGEDLADALAILDDRADRLT